MNSSSRVALVTVASCMFLGLVAAGPIRAIPTYSIDAATSSATVWVARLSSAFENLADPQVIPITGDFVKFNPNVTRGRLKEFEFTGAGILEMLPAATVDRVEIVSARMSAIDAFGWKDGSCVAGNCDTAYNGQILIQTDFVMYTDTPAGTVATPVTLPEVPRWVPRLEVQTTSADLTIQVLGLTIGAFPEYDMNGVEIGTVIVYADLDIHGVVIPEPSAAVLMGVALLLLGSRARGLAHAGVLAA